MKVSIFARVNFIFILFNFDGKTFSYGDHLYYNYAENRLLAMCWLYFPFNYCFPICEIPDPVGKKSVTIFWRLGFISEGAKSSEKYTY